MAANGGDLEAQRATYSSVMWLLKWGAVACGAIAFFVVYLLTR